MHGDRRSTIAETMRTHRRQTGCSKKQGGRAGSCLCEGTRAIFNEAQAAVDWPEYDAVLAAIDTNEPTQYQE
jgi:hypothetical protein